MADQGVSCRIGANPALVHGDGTDEPSLRRRGRPADRRHGAAGPADQPTPEPGDAARALGDRARRGRARPWPRAGDGRRGRRGGVARVPGSCATGTPATPLPSSRSRRQAPAASCSESPSPARGRTAASARSGSSARTRPIPPRPDRLDHARGQGAPGRRARRDAAAADGRVRDPGHRRDAGTGGLGLAVAAPRRRRGSRSPPRRQPLGRVARRSQSVHDRHVAADADAGERGRRGRRADVDLLFGLDQHHAGELPGEGQAQALGRDGQPQQQPRPGRGQEQGRALGAGVNRWPFSVRSSWPRL